MRTMTLSAKRQVVLPADLCRQVSLAPGAQVQVKLAPDGQRHFDPVSRQHRQEAGIRAV